MDITSDLIKRLVEIDANLAASGFDKVARWKLAAHGESLATLVVDELLSDDGIGIPVDEPGRVGLLFVVEFDVPATYSRETLATYAAALVQAREPLSQGKPATLKYTLNGEQVEKPLAPRAKNK
jgi:hypothetical protein